MDCRVVVEAAVPVYDVETADEAVRIAISKTGEMLNPDLNYVEIDMGSRACPNCGDSRDPAFIAADEGLVALELEMTVFNVERDEHAARIARKEIGQRLQNIPLEVLEVEVVADEESADGESADGDSTDEESTDEASGEESVDEGSADEEPKDVEESGDRPGDVTSDEGSSVQEGTGPVSDGEGDEGANVLPEFEDLLDEGEP